MGEETLAIERRFFESRRASYLGQHEGKFLLIKGEKLEGAFDTAQAAYEEGLRRLGNVPMLIVKLTREDSHSQVPALTLGLIRASLP